MTYRYVKEDMLRATQLYLLGAAIARGIDYTIRPPGTSLSLAWMESAAPLWVWGVILICLGVTGLIGEAWMQWGKSAKRWFLSWISHVELAQAYALFGLSALIPVFSQGYGFFVPIEWIGYALGHLIFVGRRKRA